MNFYDHINNGERYSCDRSRVAELSEYEYENYIVFNDRLCELCWNWIHLKKGECSECGSGYTHRSYYENFNKQCSCGNIVELIA